MKTTAIVSVALVASAQAFAPSSEGRVGTQLNESLFDRIANMDLFAPKADQNTYGARNKKNVSTILFNIRGSANDNLVIENMRC